MAPTGPLDPRGLRRPLFISPHLDDAVFSCGRLLASLSASHADSAVITVLAGAPPPASEVTAWDRDAGFGPDDDVVALRREEDREALSTFGAKPVWFEFPDAQYGPEPSLDEVAFQLRDQFDRRHPDAVFFPLGLFHSDHRLTCRAAVAVARSRPACRWFAYEDALYRVLPGLRDDAVAELSGLGLAVSPASFLETAEAADRKRRAVACYASQLRGLERSGRMGTDDLAAAEAYWRVIPSPPVTS